MNTERRLAASALSDPNELFGFMRRTRKPVFHKSNVFFRDIQHAIGSYAESVEHIVLTRHGVERMANDFVERCIATGVLRKVSNQAYLLNLPAFATPAAGTYTMLTLQGVPLPDSLGAK